MAFIKNIEHEEIVRLADEISANTGQVVSKTLAQNSCVSITLFAFAKGEEIGTHDSAGDGHSHRRKRQIRGRRPGILPVRRGNTGDACPKAAFRSCGRCVQNAAHSCVSAERQ